MALMNMVSSNINQWTVLAAMIPTVYSVSAGQLMAVPLDGMHRHEVLLTILQSLLGLVILLNMRCSAAEALMVFATWFAQFVVPSIREEIMYVYGLLILAVCMWRPSGRSMTRVWQAMRGSTGFCQVLRGSTGFGVPQGSGFHRVRGSTGFGVLQGSLLANAARRRLRLRAHYVR
jgi:hypothetical protein